MEGLLRFVYNKTMFRKIRLTLAVVLLLISVSMLIWALGPTLVKSRVVPVPPGDLQLPTPAAWLPYSGSI